MAKLDNYIFELNDEVERTPVAYPNRFGIRIAADLNLPKEFDASSKLPAVIVGAPYGSVKEQGPGIYAQEMARRGFAALAFDASCNGYSGEGRVTFLRPNCSSRNSAQPSISSAHGRSSTRSGSV